MKWLIDALRPVAAALLPVLAAEAVRRLDGLLRGAPPRAVPPPAAPPVDPHLASKR